MAFTSSNVQANTDAASALRADIAPGLSAENTSTVGNLLISLTSLSAEALESTLTRLALAFPAAVGRGSVLVASPDAGHPLLSGGSFGNLHLLAYSPAARSLGTLYLTAADYLNTYEVAQHHDAAACLLLGPESKSLSPECLRALAAAILDPPADKGPVDLVVPRYRLGPHEGLVNSAILYPLTRALFGTRPRFPLAIDLGLSMRMAERLATVAQTYTANGQNEAIIWPVAEAAAANWTITERESGSRALPHSTSMDLNALLTEIAGSFFADITAKASVWQRVRTIQTARAVSPVAASADGWPDVTPMLEAFRLAYTNLAEIWALVLPPNTLLGLKHLSLLPAANFRMSDGLWARIIYDFVLAYRLRTINRGHLMGALTPLYLAWVASHIILADAGTPPEQHIEDLAAIFENDKAYLVSRWRWPDRFNP